jgi:hypothetical protein
MRKMEEAFTSGHLLQSSLTALSPMAITSDEFRSVTKLLTIARRTGSMESGGTSSWAAWKLFISLI